jgi:hypothetical protein
MSRVIRALTVLALVFAGTWGVRWALRPHSDFQGPVGPLSDLVAVAETVETGKFRAFAQWLGLPSATVRWHVRMPLRLRGTVLQTEVPSGGCGVQLHEGGLFALKTREKSEVLSAASCTLIFRQANPDTVRTGGCMQPSGSLGVQIPLSARSSESLARDYVDRVDKVARTASYGYAVAWEFHPGWVIVEVFARDAEADRKRLAELLRAANFPPYTAIEDGDVTSQVWPEKEPREPNVDP